MKNTINFSSLANEKTYTRRKKLMENAIDKQLVMIGCEFLKLNPEVTFAFSKSFVEQGYKNKYVEIKANPVLICSEPLSKLTVPSAYRLDNNGYLMVWDEFNPIVRLAYSAMEFIDGEINGRLVNDLNLTFKDYDEIDKTLNLRA